MAAMAAKVSGRDELATKPKRSQGHTEDDSAELLQDSGSSGSGFGEVRHDLETSQSCQLGCSANGNGLTMASVNMIPATE